jgi:hypothetical protein
MNEIEQLAQEGKIQLTFLGLIGVPVKKNPLNILRERKVIYPYGQVVIQASDKSCLMSKIYEIF